MSATAPKLELELQLVTPGNPLAIRAAHPEPSVRDARAAPRRRGSSAICGFQVFLVDEAKVWGQSVSGRATT